MKTVTLLNDKSKKMSAGDASESIMSRRRSTKNISPPKKLKRHCQYNYREWLRKPTRYTKSLTCGWLPEPLGCSSVDPCVIPRSIGVSWPRVIPCLTAAWIRFVSAVGGSAWASFFSFSSTFNVNIPHGIWLFLGKIVISGVVWFRLNAFLNTTFQHVKNLSWLNFKLCWLN